MAAIRSFLFAPGNDVRKARKALSQGGADAVILDLEDAVAIAEKESGREPVVEALKLERPCKAYVRVNSFDTEWCFRDLMAVTGPWLDGIVLPKTENVEMLRTVDWLLSQLEKETELEQGSIDLMPIIETAKGMAKLAEISSCEISRVHRLSFGAGDYTLDLGIAWSPEDDSMLYNARSTMVLHSRAGGLEPPIDTVFVHVGTKFSKQLLAAAEAPKSLGFQGKMCIHPEQVGPVNRVFSPSKDEIKRAKEIVDEFEKAEADGNVSFQLDGAFIDYAIVEKARRVLRTAGAQERAKPRSLQNPDVARL